MRTIRMSILLAIAAGGLVSVQEPAFEVASVKLSELPGGGWRFLPPGEVWFDSEQLRMIIPLAFGVPIPLQELKVVWAPAAENLRYSPRFTIHAKGDPRHDSKAMLRTLLRQRFGLRVHTEIRQVPLYALTVKERGKLGPWLMPSPHNCREFIARGKRDDGDSPKQGDRLICWPTVGGRIQRSGENVDMWAGTITDLIERVALPAVRGDRPVIDATGLNGNFLWQIAGARERPEAISSIFEEQLGLKLESRIGPWEVIVIDDVRMPAPN